MKQFSQQLAANLRGFPFRSTLSTLRERFRDDRLGLTAGSLTFTTALALVPLVSVALTVFSAFPMFGKLQLTLSQWLAENLIPEAIARQVLSYITQFSTKASRLGFAGGAVLMVSALALAFTIDNALNRIWRVSRPRAFGQRVLTFWAALTLGPLLLAISITIGNSFVQTSASISPSSIGFIRSFLRLVEFAGMVFALAALYRFLPNTAVKWVDAVTGAIFAALAFELAKLGLAAYLKFVPSYSAIYGTFATVPLLLVWIYLVWLIVLFGAVIVAYLPSLRSGIANRGGTPGWSFQCALEVLELLDDARREGKSGLTLMQLAHRLRADPLQLQSPIEALKRLDWIGLLNDEQRPDSPRYVLLASPEITPLAPLEQALLFAPRQLYGVAVSRYQTLRQNSGAMLSSVIKP